MISRKDNSNFFVAHYDWLALAAAAAVLAFGVVMFVGSFGTDPEEFAAEQAAQVGRNRSADDTGVEAADLTAYQAVSQLLKKPPTLKSLPEKGENFLASELRVFCAFCHVARTATTNACLACGKAPEGETKVEYDTDHDEMPDEWETKYGLNPRDDSDAALDKDGDGYTNLEEFLAKTDPTDKNSHPDDLASLQLQLPLDETLLPFVFVRASPIPNGVRFYFRDPKARNSYGKKGVEYNVLAGEQIGKTEWFAESYAKSEKKVKIQGGKGETKTIDTSTATVVRKSDGRKLKLLVGDMQHQAVDVQAKLYFSRGEGQTFVVVVGQTFELNGVKYKVTDIKRVGKGAQVTLENTVTAKRKTLEALEQ